MNRRSRKGCIDCKRAKVKCDEGFPACGTCYRRGYVCQGYTKPCGQGSQTSKVNARHELSRRRFERMKNHGNYVEERQTCIDPYRGSSSESGSESPSAIYPESVDGSPTIRCPKSPRTTIEEGVVEGSYKCHPQLCQRIPFIPAGVIETADREVLEVYFARHAPQQVISVEFAAEMNENVLKVFQKDPTAVCDSLTAIGYIYSGGEGKSIVPLLDRRARILSRLREKRDLEEVLVMLLGLCALDLIDHTAAPQDTTLPTLLANAAMFINHHRNSLETFSSVAKYFIRALARQDMMVALTYSRLALIPNDVWLDEESRRCPDRFMGYITTLMPMLIDVCAIAESIRVNPQMVTRATSHPTYDSGSDDLEENFEVENERMRKFTDLRTKIHEWHPTSSQTASFKASKSLMLHAYAYKAAALLYLHRLKDPAGSSEEADRIALSMAHEILMHLSSISEQMKTALWPLFLAGCELKIDEDRDSALKLYDILFLLRRTVSITRTRDFCINRVWSARDSGNDWNWMVLVHLYPGECLPI